MERKRAVIAAVQRFSGWWLQPGQLGCAASPLRNPAAAVGPSARWVLDRARPRGNLSNARACIGQGHTSQKATITGAVLKTSGLKRLGAAV